MRDHERRPAAHAETIVESVGEALRARGERMTTPRRAVIRAMADADAHLSVEQIAARVRREDEGIHLTSVYRTLEVLGDLGVVQHVHLGHGSTAYHLVGDHGAHAHAQCRTCGAVWDLPADTLRPTAERLEAEHGFILDPTHVALSGVCARCRAT